MLPFFVINNSNVLSSELVLVGHDILLFDNEQVHAFLHLRKSGKALAWLEHTVDYIYYTQVVILSEILRTH